MSQDSVASESENESEGSPQDESDAGLDGIPEPERAQKHSPEKRRRGKTPLKAGMETAGAGGRGLGFGEESLGDEGMYSDELRKSLVLAVTSLREKAQLQENEYRKEKELRLKAEEALSKQTTEALVAEKDAEENLKRLQEDREAAIATKVSDPSTIYYRYISNT